MQNPLDLFYVHNHEKLFGNIQEKILITLKNKYILKNHICCAAKETPVSSNEYSKFGIVEKKLFDDCIEELISDSLLMIRNDKYYSYEKNPAMKKYAS